jgi:hypothetical protein
MAGKAIATGPIPGDSDAKRCTHGYGPPPAIPAAALRSASQCPSRTGGQFAIHLTVGLRCCRSAPRADDHDVRAPRPERRMRDAQHRPALDAHHLGRPVLAPLLA